MNRGEMAIVRPHDIEIHASDPGSATAGVLTRITRVGFEVRAEVTTESEVVLVTQTRAELNALGLAVGSPVWIRPVAGAAAVPALVAVS